MRMLKKVVGIILLCSVLVAGFEMPSPQAATIKAPYLAEQAVVKAPKVTVYLTGSDMDKSASVSGTVKGDKLTQDGDITTFAKSGESICYVVMIDNSSSVSRAQFEAAKLNLIEMRKNLKNKDKMVLYAVGTQGSTKSKSSIFGREASADEVDEIEADCKAIQDMEYLGGSHNSTVLYRSLNETLEQYRSPSMRTVVLIISDGEDDSAGKDNDKETTLENLQEGTLPVYGILLKNTLSSPNTEKIEFTKNRLFAEKNSKGYYYDCSMSDATDAVDKAFKKMDKIWQKETYVANLKASSNKTYGKTELNITVNNNGTNPVYADYSDYQADENGPVVAGDIVSDTKDTLTFVLSDDNGVKLDDAKDTSNYTLESVKKDKVKKTWVITEAAAVSKGNDVEVTLTVDEPLHKGDYKLTCKGIADQSQDVNIMDEETEFTLEKGASAFIAKIKHFIKEFWWILLLILIALIGAIVAYIIKNKKIDTDIDIDKLSESDTKSIILTVTDGFGRTKDIKWSVEGSLFVGRSNICNLYFPDDMLSKQHFVLDVNRMGCFLEDLQSTNGTYVNGVKVKDRRKLVDGDKITAGKETFIFHLDKEQPYINPDDVINY